MSLALKAALTASAACLAIGVMLAARPAVNSQHAAATAPDTIPILKLPADWAPPDEDTGVTQQRGAFDRCPQPMPDHPSKP